MGQLKWGNWKILFHDGFMHVAHRSVLASDRGSNSPPVASPHSYIGLLTYGSWFQRAITLRVSILKWKVPMCRTYKAFVNVSLAKASPMAKARAQVGGTRDGCINLRRCGSLQGSPKEIPPQKVLRGKKKKKAAINGIPTMCHLLSLMTQLPRTEGIICPIFSDRKTRLPSVFIDLYEVTWL